MTSEVEVSSRIKIKTERIEQLPEFEDRRVGPFFMMIFTANMMLTLNLTSEIKVKVSSFSASELQLQS